MGGVRGGRVFTGWLGLIVLYTALTESDRLSEALGIGNSALAALSDPSRPLIRDRSQTAPPPKTKPGPTPITVPHSPQPNPPPALDPFPWQHPEPDPSPAFLQRH